MCKTHNPIGSLTVIKSHLLRHNINEFSSLNEVIAFQKNYLSSRDKIISDHKILIEEESNTLSSEILQLKNTIATRKIEIENELRSEIDKLKQQLHALTAVSANIFVRCINYFRKHSIKNKIRKNELHLTSRISYSIRDLETVFTKINNRHQYITSQFMDAVYESSSHLLKELERKKIVIDKINTSIYGALGEQKVVKELEKLSDEFVLINDFSFTFPAPIFNSQTGEYIKSIQIDHILISPSGIFLIETKNWSQRSLSNLNLRSPVEQIRRANFALFMLLNGEVINGRLNIGRHHWGERKIPVRNLIVMTKGKPEGEFQYVKVLTLGELIWYVKYFKPVFSRDEVWEVADYLLGNLRSGLNNAIVQQASPF